MSKKTLSKRIVSTIIAASVCTSAGALKIPDIPIIPAVVSAASSQNRIRIDINRNDGRKALYSKNAENWHYSGSEFQSGGLTFKLSNGGSVGEGVDVINNKKLQKYDGTTPYITADGAKIKDGDNGGILKLEISGLSSGTHSFTGWHCCIDNVTNSSLKLTVDGKTVQTGIKCPTNVSNSDDAGMSYAEFNAVSGKTVTILIQGEGNASVNNAWLNGFEIDGASPFTSISRISPSDQSKHQNIEDGLSWTAGQGASSHDVYVGTDYNSVFNATKSSPEYKGTVSKSHFDLDSSYSSIPTYYWRVDENGSGGTVKGSVYSFQLNRLAFPTAEGYGRWARGGRGGRIVEVTNLNDSGEGSLRQALEVEKGPRIVVFRVGGVISLKSTLCIPDDGGDVYVAGQTAPGDGITLINYDFGAMGSEDVVIRNVRVRVGDMNGKSTGGMGLASCNNSIVDHCSISWATDEGFSSRSASDITFQWNIIGESLNESVHYNANDRNEKEPHSFAASISGNKGSFHHNLLIDCTGRNWSLAGGMENDGVTYGGALDIRNNVVYNWRDRTTDGGVRRLNFVNNYYKAGSVSNTGLHIVAMDGNELNTSDMQKMYVSGNVMTKPDGSYILRSSDNAWDKGKAKSGGKNSTNTDVRSDSPFFESYVNTDSAEDAYSKVIKSAGANYPKYDYIDSRYLKEASEGSYTYKGSVAGLTGIIDSQKDAGGYPNSSNFKGGTAPVDTDKDGMPDTWEKEHGLDPNDASDGSIVSLSADDYTNVEMYLNELAGDPVEYNGAPARSAFENFEAEDYSSESGTKNENRDDGGSHVAYIENGDHICFKNVDFETGAKSFTANLTGNASEIEIYTDKISDTPSAVIKFNGSGSWNNWEERSFNIPTISGKHDIYLVFKGGSGYLLNIDRFVFGKDSVPLNGRLISDLIVKDTERSSDWKLSDKAAAGSLLFGDREFTFKSLPDELNGAEQILTACNSKFYENDAASFIASEDITVYVALDNRVEKLPSWMNSYEKTDMTTSYNDDFEFTFYKKNFAKGDKIILGANGQSAYCVNYTVLVTEKAPEIITTTTSTTTTTTSTTSTSTTTTEIPPETVVWGDANCDDQVDMSDAVLIMQSNSNPDKYGINGFDPTHITKQGLLNADVYEHGTSGVTNEDALMIQKYRLNLVESLNPEKQK